MGLEGKYRPPDRSRYLLADEIKRLLDAAGTTGELEDRFLSFMANTGVRPSEANVLRMQDVHPFQSRVNVLTLKQRGKEHRRDVDLTPEFSRRIAEWIKGRAAAEALFPRTRQALWNIFKKVAKAAGLSNAYTLYSLRHSRAIYLLEWTKGDLVYVANQLGHSSIDVTRKYLHCLPSKREDYIKNKLGTF